MHRYYLQNRYQDSGWTSLADEDFEYCGDAICRASELAEDAVAYGMIRVMDRFTGKVIQEFPAGGRDGTKK